MVVITGFTILNGICKVFVQSTLHGDFKAAKSNYANYKLTLNAYILYSNIFEKLNPNK